MKLQTAERVSGEDPTDNYVLKRSALAYVETAKIISGKCLEIGTGSRYGLEVVVPSLDQLTTIDKFQVDTDMTDEIRNKVEFVQMTVPPFKGLADNTFDYCFTFQLIEHIQDDHLLVQEIHRVLKPGGKLICSTPNRTMSITRNPWHIREYIPAELHALLGKYFSHVDGKGVFGNEKVMKHYQENVDSVKKITRFDIFDLQHRLPRQLLQIPYDILNRFNRKKLYKEGGGSVSDIKLEDFYMDEAKEDCLDLFYIAQK
ncbi:MAG: SAM-dependent methyltransferase [Patiriisocius sp.]|jgi:SAM-dependent methyltransferase